MKPLALVTLWFLCLVPQPCTAGDEQKNADPTTLKTTDGLYWVHYQTKPKTISLNQTFAIEVSVFTDEAKTQPADAITLSVDGRMPQHRHGMNTEPVVTRQGPGRFHVAGMLFHMTGRWQLMFDISKDGETVRAQTALILTR